MGSQEIKLEPPEEHKDEPVGADPILDGIIDLSKILESQFDQFGNSDYPNHKKLGPIRRESNSSKKQKMHNRTCAVCSKSSKEEHFIHGRSKTNRLIHLVEAILGGKRTVEEAQLVMESDRIRICKSHSKDPFDEIFKVLNIRNIDEMQSCSTENKEKLMITVNALYPEFNYYNFSVLLKDYVRKLARNNRS